MSGIEWNADALLSSGIGAFIGSVLTLGGTCLAHHLAKSDAKRKDTEHTLGLLQGIYDEVDTLWGSYMEHAGLHIEELGQGDAVLAYWPITQDYFTIYNSNSFFIGKVKDHDLRRQIVATYTSARGLIDSFRMNNELLQKWEYSDMLFQESQNPLHRLQAQARYQALTQYAESLKKTHITLKAMVSELLRGLQKEGDLSTHPMS